MALAELEQRARRRLGTVLRGKYALERVLGTGGMGAVYLGVHRNGHRVAVKVLHPEAEADVRARFLREGYVANSIGHPGAVRVLDDDTAEDGAAFLVMELLEGETLHVRAKRCGGRLPPAEVLALAREICDVLAAAHDKGVVHRDIKPENLFLTTARTLKVLDFGIARGGAAARGGGPASAAPGSGEGASVEGATQAGAALGTPAFMPPEQALGKSREVDARSDLWSVGATLFALLSGQIVHEAPSQQMLLVRAATCPARSLAEAAPEVPAPIVALVDRALRSSRDERWPSARAMGEAIAEAYLAVFGEPISTAAIGPVPSAPASPATGRRAGDPVEDTQLASAAPPTPGAPPVPPGVTTRSAPDSALPGTVPDTLAPFSPQGASTRSNEGPAAATLPAAGEPPAPPQEPSATGPTLSRAAPASRPAAPPERSGKAVVLVLTLVLAVGVLIARTRRPASHDGGLAQTPRGDAVTLDAGRASCSGDAGCVEANHGQPAICRKPQGVCVPLASEGCHVLAEPGDIGNDATVWVGAMFPLHGPTARSYGEDELRMVDLARADFAEAGGLAPARAGGPRRPIAVIACDDEEEPARAAAHLVDDLGVPAILGFARSKEVTDLAATVWNPKGVLALAANTAPMLRAIPRAPGQPRMVWRVSRSSDMHVPAVAALLAEVIEPELRARPGLLAPGEPVRVALARIDNASGTGMADLYVSALRYNGESVAENGESFRQFVVADAPSEAELAAGLARVAKEVAAFLPHVVINEVDDPLIVPVERAWPASARFRPRYVPAPMDEPEILAYAAKHPELRRRMFEVEGGFSSPQIAKFVLRHNQVFPTKITAANAKGATYDAFYVLAYAAAALGDERITGPALARAIPRLLPPGEPIDVGPAGIYEALSLLGGGKNIDLAGAATTLDFDLETGEAPADSEITCLAPGHDGGPPAEVASGLVYRARAHKLEGALRCP